MVRTFCIPPDTVTASSKSERLLLLLATALMESFGIAVQIAAEPEYATVDGFVLDGERRAIVANWGISLRTGRMRLSSPTKFGSVSRNQRSSS